METGSAFEVCIFILSSFARLCTAAVEALPGPGHVGVAPQPPMGMGSLLWFAERDWPFFWWQQARDARVPFVSCLMCLELPPKRWIKAWTSLLFISFSIPEHFAFVLCRRPLQMEVRFKNTMAASAANYVCDTYRGWFSYTLYLPMSEASQWYPTLPGGRQRSVHGP